MILLIDNYDSFTYNLYQYIGTFNDDIKVVRNDKITIEEIEKMNPEKFAPAIPILGICLGHQCIGEAFGATIDHAKKIFHGKQSLVTHTGTSVFTGIDSPVKVARYHSLAIIPETVPDCLSVIAKTDDGEIMAVRHKEYKTVGLQFHPESIYTEHGKRMIENFVNDRI